MIMSGFILSVIMFVGISHDLEVLQCLSMGLEVGADLWTAICCLGQDTEGVADVNIWVLKEAWCEVGNMSLWWQIHNVTDPQWIYVTDPQWIYGIEHSWWHIEALFMEWGETVFACDVISNLRFHVHALSGCVVTLEWSAIWEDLWGLISM